MPGSCPAWSDGIPRPSGVFHGAKPSSDPPLCRAGGQLLPPPVGGDRRAELHRPLLATKKAGVVTPAFLIAIKHFPARP